MAVHAVLSASSSERWLHCPPSAMLAVQYLRTTSEYAEAGTLAHAIAELKARKHFLEPMGSRSFSARMRKFKADPHYDPGMEAATDLYLDTLKELAMGYAAPPFVALEQRVDYSDVAPGGYGTTDCIMIGGDTLTVVDYKNGAGVAVEAENNSQLMLYAWGAYRSYRAIYLDSIKRVSLVIVQPHAGGVKRWETSLDDLVDWLALTVKPTAELAAKGEGEFSPGGWCRFCPAKAECRARAEAMLALEPEAARPPALLTPEELGGVLARAAHLEAWAKDLKDLAFSCAMSGQAVPGFKLVEGRKSRDWAGGADAAFQELLARGVPEALLYERKPVTAPALEKAMGKAEFAAAAEGLVAIKPGKPALVPATDKRPEYTPAAMAFAPIENNDKGEK